MTVKELKEILDTFPDEMHVVQSGLNRYYKIKNVKLQEARLFEDGQMWKAEVKVHQSEKKDVPNTIVKVLNIPYW